MNTVTLNSMAFDNFEVADTDCLAAVEGEGFASAVAEGFVELVQGLPLPIGLLSGYGIFRQ
ncbi:hypothetical protein [Streptococcus mutans]|uniref:hypothetical protein n=1 Tax=Streptococcus mutans TaxID=1309 RepID=UPI0002B5C024|nr:hypothetical protein [Streptococcus mutans]EMC20147.1 hypothetical protein SMU81_09699 [Streptococcus mutans SF14]